MNDLIALVRRAAERWPDREALHFDATGESLSFGEFDRRTDAVATALMAAGIGAGDRVLVWAANVALYPLAWFGILKAGAIMVPLNIGYRADDALHLIEKTEPKAVFCDADRAPLLLDLATRYSGFEHIIVDGPIVDRRLDGLASFRTFVGEAPSRVAPPPIAPGDIANIQFTSGSSGMPKGCMLSHAYWVELARAVEEAVIRLEPGETMLTAQSFSYLDPQWAFVLTLSSGARLVVLDRFRPSQLWGKIAEYDACFFYCLAAMPLMLLSAPESGLDKAHRLRAIMCSAIPANRHAELEERFGVPWIEAYGATETGSDLGVRWSDHLHCRGLPTIGKPLSHREAKIVDERFRALPDGQVGELLVRGRAMMTGYWRQPDETRAAFHNGWYRTGDLARRDEEGLYYLVGRKKDMIRRAGENIAASEVETVLQQHPAVTLAACVAVPDPIRNEEVKVFVVRSGEIGFAELATFLEPRIAQFKIPRFWEFVDSLPMTPSARVAKPQLSRSIEDSFDRQATLVEHRGR